jgi:hypothetical protein
MTSNDWYHIAMTSDNGVGQRNNYYSLLLIVDAKSTRRRKIQNPHVVTRPTLKSFVSEKESELAWGFLLELVDLCNEANVVVSLLIKYGTIVRNKRRCPPWSTHAFYCL